MACPLPERPSHNPVIPQEYPKRVWYCVALGILIFILANIWAKLRRRSRRSTLAHQRPSFNRHSIYTGPISLRRLPVAIGSAWDIAAYRWSVPYGQNNVLSLTELLATMLYAAILFTWSFIDCKLHLPHGIRHGTHADFVLIQRMADRKSIGPSAQAILRLRKFHSLHSLLERIIFSLVGYLVVPRRNNKRLIFLSSVVTGISYETLNIMHRAAARVQFVLIMLHSFTKVPYVDHLLRRVRTYRS